MKTSKMRKLVYHFVKASDNLDLRDAEKSSKASGKWCKAAPIRTALNVFSQRVSNCSQLFLKPKKTLETSICKPICMQLFYAFVSAFFSLNKVLMSPICGPLFSLRNHSGANLPHPFNVWYIFNFVKLFENTQWTPTNIKHPFNVWYIFSFAKQQQNYFVLVKQQSHKTWEGHQKQYQHVLGFG